MLIYQRVIHGTTWITGDFSMELSIAQGNWGFCAALEFLNITFSIVQLLLVMDNQPMVLWESMGDVNENFDVNTQE